MNHETSPVCVSIAQACTRWSIGKTKLYELIKGGDIRAVKIGARTLIDVRSGDGFFASLPSFGKRGGAPQ